MIKIKKLMWSMLLVLGVVALSSCEKGEDKPGGGDGKPLIELAQSELTVSHEGGTFNVRFSIVNPVEGQGALATPDETWISEVFVDDLNGIITFDVAENPAREGRQAIIEVNYPGVEAPAQLNVIQEGDSEPLFVLDNVSVTYSEITFDMIPTDKFTPYLINVNSKNYMIDYGMMDDDDAVFEDDMAYFEFLGYWNGMSALEILRVRARTGDSLEQILSSCVPGTEYVLYAYHVDVQSGERLSEVTRFIQESQSVELTDEEFEIEYEVSENFVKVDVSPKGFSGNYYFDMLPADQADQYIEVYGGTLEDYIENWWNSNVSNDMSNGAIADRIISEYCSQGDDSYTFDLLAQTRYYIVAFAVEGHAYCGSVPKYVEATTSTVSSSDLVVSPYSESVRSINAVIGYNASNDTDPYLSGIIKAEELNSFGSDNDSKIRGILSVMDNYEPSYGSFKGQVQGLTPGTEYVVFAFGFRGGIPTTDLFTSSFTTLSDEPGNATVVMDNQGIGYFDINDIAEVYPNYAGTAQTHGDIYAFYPVTVKSDPFGCKIYYVTYTWASQSAYELFIEENPNYLVEQLLRDGVKPSGKQLIWVEYGMYNTVLSMAEDSEGRYSKMNVDGFNVSKSGVSDIDLFISWQEGTLSVPTNYVQMHQPKSLLESLSSIQTLSNGASVIEEEVLVPSEGVRFSTSEKKEFIPAVNQLSPVRK